MSCTTAVHDFIRVVMSSWPTLCFLLMCIFLHVWKQIISLTYCRDNFYFVRLRLITPTSTLIILDITNASSNYGIISIRLKVFLPP